MYIDVHVKYALVLLDFNENLIYGTGLRKNCPDIKFHENPSSVSRVGSMRTDRREEAHSRFSYFCERAHKIIPRLGHVKDSRIRMSSVQVAFRRVPIPEYLQRLLAGDSYKKGDWG
jgi:hypothetical protein